MRFEKRFGVRPVEGYGATELSPVVSANLPPSRAASKEHQGVKEGTVGIPLPGVRVKVVDLDTGKDLGPNKSGMLLVSGPNVMKGYYARPDLTADVIREEKGDAEGKGTVPDQPSVGALRNGPKGASHKWGLSPFPVGTLPAMWP